MDFEKIEQAYTYLLENVQVIQSDLATNFYDALVEQNSIYLDGETELEQVKENNQALKRLALRKEEWLKTYQFLLMKGGQTEPLQANHQLHQMLLLYFWCLLWRSCLKRRKSLSSKWVLAWEFWALLS